MRSWRHCCKPSHDLATGHARVLALRAHHGVRPCGLTRHPRNQRCAEACKRAWRERDSRARAHQAQRGCVRRAIFGGATAQHDAADAGKPTPESIDAQQGADRDDSAEAHFEGGGATCPVLPLSLLLRVILVSVLARVSTSQSSSSSSS